MTKAELKVGGRYNWVNQPERLVYVGLCEPRNGRWHQFAKVEYPTIVWCEVLDSDLSMIEETPPAPQAEPAGYLYRAKPGSHQIRPFINTPENRLAADYCEDMLYTETPVFAPEGAVETAKASEAKDAARYRWLRDEDVEVPDGQRDISVWLDRLPHSDQFDKQLFGEEMDAAIDAALATPSTEGAK